MIGCFIKLFAFFCTCKLFAQELYWHKGDTTCILYTLFIVLIYVDVCISPKWYFYSIISHPHIRHTGCRQSVNTSYKVSNLVKLSRLHKIIFVRKRLQKYFFFTPLLFQWSVFRTSTNCPCITCQRNVSL